MVLGVHLADDFGADSVLVEDVGRAYGADGHLAVVFLFAPCAQALEQAVVGVGQKREGEFVLGGELEVGLP